MSKLWVAVFASTLLAACGGDTITGQTSTTTTGTGTVATVTGISLITSSPQVQSDNTGPATITAYAHDANNNIVNGATIAFSASSGLLAVTQAATDTTGAATATLSAGSDPSNRTITVTASAGPVSATVTVDVIGSTLQVTGPPTLVEPGVATYTIILKNAGGVGIEGQAVTLSSANKNTLSASSVTTDVNGQATFTVTAANGGADTLSATALGLTATEAVAVSTESFAFTAPVPAVPPAADPEINIGTTQNVSVLWKNGANAVPDGTIVTFASTRGTLSASTKGTVGGVASVTITSTTAGPAVITATGNGVSTQVAVDFLATTPTVVAVQASPSTIPVSGQSTITAVVRDAKDNLVQGATVTFALTNVPPVTTPPTPPVTDVTGGTLSAASALTNAQGVATTIYTASTTTSATNGVPVTATVQGASTTGIPGGPAVYDTAYLTVAGKTTFLSLGTGNTIDVLNETQYGMPFSVTAIDQAGNPVTGITINLTTTSVWYRKGYMTFGTSPAEWTILEGSQSGIVCPSEDVNNNGILDPGEDTNKNGKLDPGSVAIASPGSVVTSAVAGNPALPLGSASFEVVYPKDHAYWVEITLTATTTVAGTQSSTSTTFVLTGLASDYTSQTIEPPGETSPYGTYQSCGPSPPGVGP